VVAGQPGMKLAPAWAREFGQRPLGHNTTPVSRAGCINHDPEHENWTASE